MADVNILGAIVDGKIPFIIFLLGALAVFFTVKVLFFSYKKKSRKTNKARMNKKEDSLSIQLIEKGGAYVSKGFMMTPIEQKVYKVLERKYGEQYYIFAQVRVVDVLQPNVKKYLTWTKEYKALFWQVSQWHFDYVMCHKDDFRIYCALELDDSSHEKPDRKRRDIILNNVCRDAGVMLNRMSLNYENKKVEVLNVVD
ncbi:DUF2726 domain-containing protein [Halovibrio sp. HP20-50]|uniref:DUF2726 domain-containing protein n=1 Tax=Halovibrio sp. HP20-59 TaxID=3080275 RepID=UPI00294AA13A|nr:DUF2726 domain-containing protein [Halovibrio sp. HP20-59]MEA2119790.1 DUF2726 domain-containing protein [Halovibrio sp. HP20-59]